MMKSTFLLVAALLVAQPMVYAQTKTKATTEETDEKDFESYKRWKDEQRKDSPRDESPRYSDSVSSRRPNVVSLELLGRAAAYSLNYDRSVSDSVSIGAGLSYFGFETLGANVDMFLLPIYVNYYFNTDNHRPFISGGPEVVIASGTIGEDERISGSGAIGVIGGGYEYRGDGGFVFRVAPYLLIGNAVKLWFGVGFGYAF